MLVCAGSIEQIVGAIPIGIGLVQSAINLTKICLESKPCSILFVGSAGSYGVLNIFDIVKSTQSVNLEHSYLESNSYTPIDLRVGDFSVPHRTIVNSSNYITCSRSISQKFLQHGVGIENMEFFSVMSVALRFGIKVSGVFVVTNFCFEDAKKEFSANHSRAIKLLEEYINDK